MDEENLRRSQALTTRLQQLQAYLQMLEEQTQEVARAVQAIDDIQHAKKGTELYAPLTNGILIKATLEDASTLLINVGNDVITEHTPAQAKRLLEDQQAELAETQQGLVKQFSELYQEYIQLQLGGKEE